MIRSGALVAAVLLSLLALSPGSPGGDRVAVAGGSMPACPGRGPAERVGPGDVPAARTTALRFATAWWTGDRATVEQLADGPLRADLRPLWSAAAGAARALPDAAPDVARLPLVGSVRSPGHSSLAGEVVHRCGLAVLPTLLVAEVHPSAGRGRSQIQLVLRPEGFRVWAVR